MRDRRYAGRRFEFKPYEPKIHYGAVRTLCNIEKSGSKDRLLTLDINTVTCKLCIRKYKKGNLLTEHFEDEGLFTI